MKNVEILYIEKSILKYKKSFCVNLFNNLREKQWLENKSKWIEVPTDSSFHSLQ